MSVPRGTLSSYNDIALGDLVTIPDGHAYSVRAVIRFPMPHNSVSGFLILGEFEAALSLPSLQTAPAGLMTPGTPDALKGQQVQVVVEGATRFWPPHIPAVPGAMIDIPYRVLAVRGQEHPVLVCFRGPEVIVFGRSRSVWMSEIGLAAMHLSDALDGPQLARRSGEVLIDTTSPVRPTHVPSPAQVPSEPLRVPAGR